MPTEGGGTVCPACRPPGAPELAQATPFCMKGLAWVPSCLSLAWDPRASSGKAKPGGCALITRGR